MPQRLRQEVQRASSTQLSTQTESGRGAYCDHDSCQCMCSGASISSCLLECLESKGINNALGCPAQVSPAMVLEQQSSMAANATTLHQQSCSCTALAHILNRAACAVMLCHPFADQPRPPGQAGHWSCHGQCSEPLLVPTAAASEYLLRPVWPVWRSLRRPPATTES